MKKIYETPKIFRIRLNHEQAILSTCSTTTVSTQSNGTAGCRINICRKAVAAVSLDSGISS